MGEYGKGLAEFFRVNDPRHHENIRWSAPVQIPTKIIIVQVSVSFSERHPAFFHIMEACLRTLNNFTICLEIPAKVRHFCDKMIFIGFIIKINIKILIQQHCSHSTLTFYMKMIFCQQYLIKEGFIILMTRNVNYLKILFLCPFTFTHFSEILSSRENIC